MRHPDGEALAQLALTAAQLDVPAEHDPTVAEHVRGCPQCADEVIALSRTVELARSEDADSWPAPPSRVWDAIVAELGVSLTAAGSSPAGEPAVGSVLAGPATPELSAGRAEASMPGGPAEVATGRHSAPVTDIASRRSGAPGAPRWALPVAAALVGMVAGGAVIWAVRSPAAAGGPASVVATAALVPVPGGPGKAPESGRAELLDAPNGPVLKVNSANLPHVSGSYEVWLLGIDGRMVSLGVLDSGAGWFTVPHGISTTDYGTVDISDEPPDGNPAHSKVSVLRGPLS